MILFFKAFFLPSGGIVNEANDAITNMIRGA